MTTAARSKGQADFGTRRSRRFVWFKSGGDAEWLFEPADVDDLTDFLRELDPEVPVMALGPGIQHDRPRRRRSRRGRPARQGLRQDRAAGRDDRCSCGGGASGILVSSTARDAGIAGLEFLRGIPGTVGGFVRMNGGAYGREVQDMLVSATLALRDGESRGMAARTARLHLSPQRIARGRGGHRGDACAASPAIPRRSGPRWTGSPPRREESQPLRSRTGGSTFKNPPGHKAWALIDAAGCRGMTLGGAQVSEKHCNFLLNLGSATSADIEALGEEVRRRVQAKTNITLEWEIQRIGTE